VDYLALAHSLKEAPSPLTNQLAPNWTADTCCLCTHCVFALTFLRVFSSLSNQPSFVFDRVEEREATPSHASVLIIFQQTIAEGELAELCVPVSAILREESNKRRRSSLSSDDAPIKKRTRGVGPATSNTTGVGEDRSESESDDEDDPPPCADEWDEGDGPTESAEVERVEFSIFLSQKSPTQERDEEPADGLSAHLR
jgi:hypothetical protein